MHARPIALAAVTIMVAACSGTNITPTAHSNLTEPVHYTRTVPDRVEHDRAAQRALDSGQIQTWRNPENGNYGRITPLRSYTDDEGDVCRKYIQAIQINGMKKRGSGTACLDDNGTWQLFG